MKAAIQLEDVNGNLITVTFRADDSPSQAVKITGGIANDLRRIEQAAPPAAGQSWGVTDDCHAMTFTKRMRLPFSSLS